MGAITLYIQVVREVGITLMALTLNPVNPGGVSEPGERIMAVLVNWSPCWQAGHNCTVNHSNDPRGLRDGNVNSKTMNN